MKKLFALLLAFLSFSLAWADGATVTYTFSDGTTSVQSNVTTISNEQIFALQYYYKEIVSVKVEGDLESIESYAFNNCSSLATFSVNGSIGEIGELAFGECSSLTTFSVTGSISEIGEYAFDGCSSLSTFAVTGTVGSFGDGVFEECTSLNSVTFSEESPITSISQWLFFKCSSLTSFTIPSTVTEIGEYAFQQSGLTSITIPKSVTSIGGASFVQCSDLASITFEDESQLTSIGIQAFESCTSLTSLTIPSTVIEIGNYAFRYCSSLKDVTCLATELPTLGSSVFSGISETAVLIVPEGYESAYANSTWGEYFEVEGYIEGTEIADEESGLTYVITDQYEKTVTITGFTCSESVTIPESITYNDIEYTIIAVADGVFDCEELKEVTMEATEPPFDASVFENIADDAVLIVPEGAEDAYVEAGWHDIFIIDGYVEVGDTFVVDGVEYEITGDGEVKIVGATEDEITITENVSFNGFDFTVTEIAEGTFADATNVTITIEYTGPDAITITEGAFSGGFSGTLIVPEGYERAFANSTWGEYFEVEGYIEGTEIADEESGLTYEITDQYEKTVTITGFTCSESVTIPASITYNDVEYTITAVADGVFNCEELKEVTMEATEPPFDASVFGNIANDAVLIVPKGSERTYANSTWGEYFEVKGYIEGTEIADEENGLTYVITDQYEKTVTITAFTCADSVTIPESITYNDVEYTITAVADDVFNCSSLKEVTMEATEPPFDASVFENIADDAVLIVPEGAKEAYSSWSDSFTEILDGTESSTTLISINSEKKEIARYNLLGQKITTLQRGINIVKYSDGSVEKVLVR